MRISLDDKQYIKSNIKTLAFNHSKLNQSEIARKYNVSRPTVKRWVNEIRTEQIRDIDAYSLEEEMRLLETKSKRYLTVLQRAHQEYFAKWDRNLPSLINLFRLMWSIDKDVFFLKLNLYSKALSPEQKRYVDSVGQKMMTELN